MSPGRRDMEGGEAYVLDRNYSADPPLWWINTTNHASGHRAGNRAAGDRRGCRHRRCQRGHSTLPDGFQGWRAGDVELAVVPAGSVNAYAVEETVPAGWEVTDTSDQGVYHAASGIVRWGPSSMPRRGPWPIMSGRHRWRPERLQAWVRLTEQTPP